MHWTADTKIRNPVVDSSSRMNPGRNPSDQLGTGESTFLEEFSSFKLLKKKIRHDARVVYSIFGSVHLISLILFVNVASNPMPPPTGDVWGWDVAWFIELGDHRFNTVPFFLFPLRVSFRRTRSLIIQT